MDFILDFEPGTQNEKTIIDFEVSKQGGGVASFREGGGKLSSLFNYVMR